MTFSSKFVLKDEYLNLTLNYEKIVFSMSIDFITSYDEIISLNIIDWLLD